ncbi:MAG: hypothetical protein ACR2JH_01085 [Solirubrobacteraceae bacterium]
MRRGVSLGVLAGLTLGGCSPLGGVSTTSSTSTSRLAQAQAAHEYRSPEPRPQTAAALSASAVAAVRAFAAGYINWTADTVASQMRQLAAGSIGQARSAMQLAAAQTANDYELQRGGIANHGSVEAIAPLRGSGERYVVVTREATTAALSSAYQGLRPAWHVAVATVSALGPGRWVVSGWQPES